MKMYWMVQSVAVVNLKRKKSTQLHLSQIGNTCENVMTRIELVDVILMLGFLSALHYCCRDKRQLRDQQYNTGRTKVSMLCFVAILRELLVVSYS